MPAPVPPLDQPSGHWAAQDLGSPQWPPVGPPKLWLARGLDAQWAPDSAGAPARPIPALLRRTLSELQFGTIRRWKLSDVDERPQRWFRRRRSQRQVMPCRLHGLTLSL